MKTLKNAFWLTSGRAIADFSSIVLFTVLSRTLGPRGVGEYAYAFALGNLVGLIASCGYEDYGVRELACAGRERAQQVWRELISTQVLQLALALCILVALALANPGRAARPAVILEFGVFFCGWLFARTAFVPTMAQQSMQTPALVELTCRTGAVLVAIALALGRSASLPVLLIGFPLAGLAMAGLAGRNARQCGFPLRIHPTWRGVRATLNGTAPFAANDFLGMFYARTDVLIITWFLGASATGLYAPGVKFVEVGLLPLVLSGMAVYPLLSRLAAAQPPVFVRTALDFLQLLLALSGWLAVGIATVVPLIVVPLFGRGFTSAVPLLGWFSLLALAKGAEAALFRLLYCVRRQGTYARALVIGTAVTVVLNCALIPLWGIRGALAASVTTAVVVDIACIRGLRSHLPTAAIAGALLRLLAALTVTAAAGILAWQLGADAWLRALVCCVLFPAVAWASGLAPNLRASALLARQLPEADAAHSESDGAQMPSRPVRFPG